jgi:hypothetical protein
VLARRLVEAGGGEQPDRDLLLDLSAVHEGLPRDLLGPPAITTDEP